MTTISLEKSLLNEMGNIMGDEDLMTQTIKFVRSIRRKAKADGKDLETLDMANFKAYVKSL